MLLENIVYISKQIISLLSNIQTEAPSDEMSSSSSHYRGEIIVAMKFVTNPSLDGSSSSAMVGSGSMVAKKNQRKAKGMLMVLIKEAKNLVPAKGSSNTDPFCKW